MVGIHDAEMPFGVHEVGVGIAPDLDVIGRPVGAAEVDLGTEEINESVDVHLICHVGIIL